MRKILAHPLSMILVSVAAILFLLSLKATQQKTTTRGEIVEKNQAVVDQLKNEQAALQQQLEESQLPFNQEIILRNELRKQKEGEIVIQIPSIAPQITPPSTPTPTMTNLDAWKKVLF